MKTGSLILALASAAAIAIPTSAHAGDVLTYSNSGGSLYNAGELQLDIFGAYGFEGFEDESFFGDDVAGGGVGVNYFLTRNLGLGVEGILYDTDPDPFGSTAVNLILRAPIGDSGLSIYGFGGVGAIFNADKVRRDDFRNTRDRLRSEETASGREDALFEAHVGAGVEFRFNPNVGLFSDVRHTFVEDDVENFSTARVGLRITF